MAWRNPFKHRSAQSDFFSQNDQNTLGQPWPKVKQGQNPHKITFFMVLYQTQGPRRFLASLTKFDLELTLGRPQKPKF